MAQLARPCAGMTRMGNDPIIGRPDSIQIRFARELHATRGARILLQIINRRPQSGIQFCVPQGREKFLSSSAEEDRIAHLTWLSPAPTAEVSRSRQRRSRRFQISRILQRFKLSQVFY